MTKPPEYNEIMNLYKNNNVNKTQKILNIINKYKINYYFSEKLEILKNYNILLLIDDSGSMNTLLNDYPNFSSRWGKVKQLVNSIIDIGTIYNENGIDIYFLNRPKILNIKTKEQVHYIFDILPTGETPLTKRFNQILNDYKNNNKQLLIIILTDGVPYVNCKYDLNNFKNILKKKDNSKNYISFLACSDNLDDIGYLNKLNNKKHNISVLNDYYFEYKKFIKVRGNNYKYSFGNHIVRLLLGPLIPKLDKLNKKI